MLDQAERRLREKTVILTRRRGIQWLRRLLLVLGPGIITGIVDNDPTGITGYALAGGRFGYDLLWVLLLTTVALAVALEMGGRLGVVTGKGLADLIRERFGVRIAALAMLALLVANVTTTVAEFAGVAGASELFGVSRYIAVPLAAVLVMALVVLGSYRRVEAILLAGTLIFAAYIATAFFAHPDWDAVARHSVVPSFRLSVPFITIVIGLVGTTITPWMQFYLQSSTVDKGIGERELKLQRLDIYSGAFFCNLVAFFIVVTTAATLHAHSQPVETVEDVAQSLGPLAGAFASELFAVGLLTASLMAATVLPLSTAYAVCEAFGWERSVNRSLREAPVFYSLFGGLIVIGATLVLIPGIPLLLLLYLPNVVGGILLPLILFFMLKLVNDQRIMGKWVNSWGRNVIAWTTTVVMVVLTAVYLVVAILEATGVISRG